MTSTREPLVNEDRLSRAWEVITSRVPGQLDDAVPDAYVQPASDFQNQDGKIIRTKPVAVFAVAEPNPRHIAHLQVSLTHMPLEGWQELERDAKHFVSKDFDPLQWCLLQAAMGHMRVMSNIRSMSHPVEHIDEHGKKQLTYPTGGEH